LCVSGEGDGGGGGGDENGPNFMFNRYIGGGNLDKGGAGKGARAIGVFSKIPDFQNPASGGRRISKKKQNGN